MTFTGFDLIKAFGLGLVEGLTAFVPVSSTGHLLLVQRLLGLDQADLGRSFALLIRLGALAALLSVYFVRLGQLVAGISGDPAARRFAVGVLVASLPAAVVGALAHDAVASALLNVWIVCFALIVGGAVLLGVDRLDREPRYRKASGFSLPMCWIMGLPNLLP
jgi:undecaprenyl-diphosphatase